MLIKTLSRPCSFCLHSGRHELCPRGILNGDGKTLLLCPCEEPHPAEYRCLSCSEKDLTKVDPETWQCYRHSEPDVDPDAGRTTAPRRRASTTSGTPRGTTGSCVHCDEPTKGGKFLPGHDTKYVRQVAELLVGGDLDNQAAVDLWSKHSLSPALWTKLEKRVATLTAERSAK